MKILIIFYYLVQTGDELGGVGLKGEELVFGLMTEGGI